MKNPFLVPGQQSAEPVEDLSDEAIIAHEAPVHAPQPRVAVREARRSVVIKERGWGDRTVVLPKLAREAGDSKWQVWLLWTLAGALAFSLGGLLAMSVSRSSAKAAEPAAAAAHKLQGAHAAEPAAQPAARTAPPAPVNAPGARERVVSVQELPIER